jgi:hypothetical protein
MKIYPDMFFWTGRGGPPMMPPGRTFLPSISSFLHFSPVCCISDHICLYALIFINTAGGSYYPHGNPTGMEWLLLLSSSHVIDFELKTLIMEWAFWCSIGGV